MFLTRSDRWGRMNVIAVLFHLRESWATAVGECGWAICLFALTFALTEPGLVRFTP